MLKKRYFGFYTTLLVWSLMSASILLAILGHISADMIKVSMMIHSLLIT